MPDARDHNARIDQWLRDNGVRIEGEGAHTAYYSRELAPLLGLSSIMRVVTLISDGCPNKYILSREALDARGITPTRMRNGKLALFPTSVMLNRQGVYALIIRSTEPNVVWAKDLLLDVLASSALIDLMTTLAAEDEEIKRLRCELERLSGIITAVKGTLDQ